MRVAFPAAMQDFDPKLDPVRAILWSPTLSQPQKIGALLQMAYDACQQDVATEDGMMDMSRERSSSLAEIQRALRDLGVSDLGSGARQ